MENRLSDHLIERLVKHVDRIAVLAERAQCCVLAKGTDPAVSTLVVEYGEEHQRRKHNCQNRVTERLIPRARTWVAGGRKQPQDEQCAYSAGDRKAPAYH